MVYFEFRAFCSVGALEQAFIAVLLIQARLQMVSIYLYHSYLSNLSFFHSGTVNKLSPFHVGVVAALGDSMTVRSALFMISCLLIQTWHYSKGSI